jgi:transposase
MVRALNRIRKFLDFHGKGLELTAGKWRPREYRIVRQLRFAGSLQTAWEVMWALVDQLQEHKKRLRSALLELSKTAAYRQAVKVFSSAPGIGCFTAIRLALEWGDLGRFDSGKEFGSYTGLVCSEYSTGDTVHRGRITGQGRGFVRRWLIESSWVAIRYDVALRNKFESVWSRSGSKKKAIVAVARKLAVRLRSIFITKQEYQLGVIQ